MTEQSNHINDQKTASFDKSVSLNMALNIIRTLLSVVFPLITYPYVTRILGVDNFGKVSYSQSIINYFTLIAGLGISSYAIREGGVQRTNRESIDSFASQLFSMNLFFTLLAYGLLGVLLLFSAKVQNYRILLLILSLSMLFTTIGVDWINVIFEDYLYITVRSFLIQLLTIVLLFVFVKSKDDYYRYAFLTVSGNALIAISNFVYTRRYCKIKITTRINARQHIKPTLILFSNSIAVTVYSSVDSVMLGFFTDDYCVGIYAVAVRVYTILKQLVAAVYTVTVTRLTAFVARKDNDAYQSLLDTIINNIIVISIPIVIGMVCISKSVVTTLAGSEYQDSSFALSILSLTISFSVLGGAIAYCVNLPHKKEKNNLISTVIGAVENFLLNIWAIPHLKVAGAAYTTLISETTVFIILFFSIKSYWHLFDKKSIFKNVIKCLVSCIPFVILVRLYLFWIPENSFVYLICSLTTIIILYLVTNLLLRNKYLFNLIKDVTNRIKRNCK